MKTEQLDLWCGEFGQNYLPRNQINPTSISNRINVWAQILKSVPRSEINSILEVGSNIGMALRALKLITQAELFAIEPYKNALEILIEDKVVKKENAFCTSIFNSEMFADNQIDLVFTGGVLIHIAPSDLKKATDNIVRISKRYIVCIEYFSDKEESIIYRGQEKALFKRDFGSFYLDSYPQLKLKDYGFFWKRATGVDNSTWWLFEKG